MEDIENRVSKLETNLGALIRDTLQVMMNGNKLNKIIIQ
jgi:hypothetical protein